MIIRNKSQDSLGGGNVPYKTYYWEINGAASIIAEVAA